MSIYLCIWQIWEIESLKSIEIFKTGGRGLSSVYTILTLRGGGRVAYIRKKRGEGAFFCVHNTSRGFCWRIDWLQHCIVHGREDFLHYPYAQITLRIKRQDIHSRLKPFDLMGTFDQMKIKDCDSRKLSGITARTCMYLCRKEF